MTFVVPIKLARCLVLTRWLEIVQSKLVREVHGQTLALIQSACLFCLILFLSEGKICEDETDKEKGWQRGSSIGQEVYSL